MYERSSFHCNNEKIRFLTLYHMFSQTGYGEILGRNVRFSGFKPESISNTTWEQLLGKDVNNLRHLYTSYAMTRAFLRFSHSDSEYWPGEVPQTSQFSPKEQELLMLTAIVHDWAEAITGDKAFTAKTATDEENELVHLGKLTRDLIGDKDSKVQASLTTITEDILCNKDSKLGKAFNAIERVGYIRTGLRAWKVARSEEYANDEQLVFNLKCLSRDVLTNHLSKVVAYGCEYPAVAKFLMTYRDVLNDAFTSMPEQTLHQYPHSMLPNHLAAYDQSRLAWQSWENHFTPQTLQYI